MIAEAKESVRASLKLPTTFGRYVLFDFIGRGGMAELYLGRTTTEFGGARLVVVKQILPSLSGLDRFAEMLIHEAKIAAELNHANIVQVFDLGRERDQLFIAMEYVEGFDLNTLIKRCSKEKVPLPLEFALHIVVSMLRALDYAHRRTGDDGDERAIIHRDISPSNVLISFEGEIKLCDFGIAHAHDQALRESGETIQGKASYMSPEQARGDLVDARSDIFSAGIVFWELLAGRRLYPSDTPRSNLLELARQGEVPSLPIRGFAQESALHAIVMKALAFNPEDRFQTAAAMTRALEEYIAKSGKFASPLRFGDWLIDHFGADIVERRRSRERAAAALAKGPLVELTPIGAPATGRPAVTPDTVVALGDAKRFRRWAIAAGFIVAAALLYGLFR